MQQKSTKGDDPSYSNVLLVLQTDCFVASQRECCARVAAEQSIVAGRCTINHLFVADAGVAGVHHPATQQQNRGGLFYTVSMGILL